MRGAYLCDKLHWIQFILYTEETADLLTAAGKSAWFTQCEKHLKLGSGESQAFWLDPGSNDNLDETLYLNNEDYQHPALIRATELINRMDENCPIKAKHQRLIDWIVDQMEVLLKQVVVQREFMEAKMAHRRNRNGILCP